MKKFVLFKRIFLPIGTQWTLIGLLLLFGTVASFGQFAFSDQASNYGGVLANGNNQGTGYNAWVITTGGANAGTFVGNPLNGGMGTAGIGTTAFGMFGYNGQFVNAVRFFGVGGTNVPMQIGDVFTFHWAMNWDAGGGSKGFDFRADGTTIFNVNNGGIENIETNNGSADGTYGTNPMLVTLTRTSWTQYTFTMTRRSDGSTYSTTINSSANINNINIYCGNQPDNHVNRDIYFNNFNFTKAEPYETNFDLTDPRVMTGSSNLTKTGNGNLTLNAANTFTGNTLVNQNFLIVGNDNRFGAIPGGAAPDKIQIGNGTLGISASMTINANRGMTLTNAGSSIDVFSGQTATYNGIIAGSGAHVLTKAGAGTLILGGANTYSGNTTVSNGVIRITNGSALGTNVGGTTVNPGQVVEFSGVFDTSEPFTLNGFGVSGGGALRNITNNSRILSGQVLLASDARINSDVATLNISAIDLNTNTLDVSSGSGGTVNLSTTLLNGGKTSGNGAIFKDGAGELRLSGAFTALTGNVNLVSGTIRIDNNAALGNSGILFMSNGTTLRPDDTTTRNTPKNVTLNGNVTLGYASQGLTLSGSVNLNGGTRTITSIFDNVISGPISNGALTKVGAGNLSLSGSNTYAGDTRINEGNLTSVSAGAFGGGTDVYISDGTTLTVSASTSAASVREAGFLNSGTAVLNTGTILTINGANKGNFFQNSISGAGGLTMAGSGTTNMTLFGTQSYTGATTVSAAMLTTGVPTATGSLTVSGGSFETTIADVLADNIPVTVSGGVYNMGGSDQVGSVAGTGGTINLNAHTLATGNNNSNTNFSGIIAGSGSITKTGTGNWTLGGQNTYTGLTTVSSGALFLSGTDLANNTIPGNILINGGTLQYGNVADNQIADASNITLSSGTFNAGARTETVASITMSGGLMTKGGNTLIFNAPASITGGIVIMSSSGGYTFNGNLTLGNTTVDNTAISASGGTFRIGGTVTVNDGTNPNFTNTGGGLALRFNLNDAIRTFNVGAGANLIIDWRINSTTASSGGITKTGPGTMTLTAPNNTLYTNTTTITVGELRLNPSANAALNSQIVLNGGVLATTNIATGRVFTNSSNLRLDNSSTAALGSNAHELRFANSSGETWNVSATLTITGWAGTAGNPGTGGRIFVGSAANHLTEAQINRITFTSYGPAILLSTGELVPRRPEIFVTVPGGILFPFTIPEGGASAEQTLTVSGTQLNDGIVLTAPTGYEISLTSGSGFTTAITLSPTNFAVSATTIYVRLAGIAAGYANGNMSATSTGATTQIVALHGAVLTADAITINFDSNVPIWQAGSGLLTSYRTDHQYNQLSWNFTGGPALRNGTTAVDGFPGALGSYSWELQAGGAPDWRATFTQGGTVTSFGFKVRRWDDSPDPNYAVQFSTDGGATWSAVLATINNALLAAGSQWRVFNHILSPAVDFDPGDLIIRVLSSGGERIMIDDFHYDISVCTNTAWHYRSAGSGNWAAFNTWEHSVDGNPPWTIPTCGPTSASAAITVRNGHTVTVNTSVTIDQTLVENGGRILQSGGTIGIADGSGDDLVIQNGGVYEITGGTAPAYTNTTVRIRVNTGGTIRISSGVIADISVNMAGNNSSNRVIYDHQSVFEWNNSSPFATANQTYFPNADATTIPVFRVSTNTGNVGASNPTIINGLYEANGNSNWVSAGAKTFRNGIIGSGNITSGGGGIAFVINGSTGIIGGTGSIGIPGNGLLISAGTNCTLVSNKVCNGFAIIVFGILNTGEFVISGTHSAIQLGVNGIVNTANPAGLGGNVNATFANISATFTLGNGSLVNYNRAGDQIVTVNTAYSNLRFSGSGTKSFAGNTTLNGTWNIVENVIVGASTDINLLHNGSLNVNDNASFNNDAYNRINLIANSASNQLYTSNSGNPIRLRSLTSNKTSNNTSLRLASGNTSLDVRNDLIISMPNGTNFRDNGNLIAVGGNVIIDGGITTIELTGTLECNGASGAPQVIEAFPNEVILTRIFNFRLVGSTTDVAFAPNTGTQTIRIDGNVNIQAGILRPRNNIIDLRGNWSNYGSAGLDEAGSRLLFQGTTAQTITCPGDEVFNFLATSKTLGSFTLNNNITVSGSGADIATFTTGLLPAQNIPINLNGNRLSFTGAGGGSIRMQNGQVTFTGPTGSIVEIDGSNKIFLGVSSGSCLIDNNVTLNLRSGLDCGTAGLTVVNGTLQISNNGFVITNPPLYSNNSTLRYATTGPYNRAAEWNTLSGNIGFPFNVQIFGTNPLNMGTGATDRPIRGNLTIDQVGALNMNSMTGNLVVPGNVSIGGGTAMGSLTLSDTFNGDLLVGGNLVRHSTNGTFVINNREVEMVGVGNVQNIENIPSFAYLAINNNGGSVVPNGNTTITERLQLSNGTLNVGAFDMIMANNKDLWRNSSAATISKSPIVTGTDRYNIYYRINSFTTGLEWNPADNVVADLIVEGSITTTLGGSRTFNRNMFINGANIDLGSHVLTARGRDAVGTYSGDLTLNGSGVRSITGAAGSRFDITGLGEAGDLFYTKRFTQNNGTTLVFTPNVEVRIGNGGCNFGFGVNYPTVLDSYVTIQGVLAVLGGGYAIGTPCYYATNSILRFANGFDYTVQSSDLTWSTGTVTSSAPGIPFNVDVLGAATELLMNSPRSLRNNLNIVDGDFTLTANSGTFDIGGNWSRSGAPSAFNHGMQEVIFNGTGAQTITTTNISGSGGETFSVVSFDNTGTKTLNEAITVLNDLNIRGTGPLAANGQNINIFGTWNNDVGTASFTEGSSTVIFANTTAFNTIEANGGEDFHNIIVNNTFGDGRLLLKDVIRVGGTMTFTNGIVQSETPADEVVIKNGALTAGEGIQSFVNGYVRKIGFDGSTYFEYPTGDYEDIDPMNIVKVFMPAGVRAVSASTSAAYSVRYFHENHNPAYSSGSNKPPRILPLTEVSTCNYWDIDRVVGSINADIRLYWNEISACYDVNQPASLTVAHFNGSSWETAGVAVVNVINPNDRGYTQTGPFSSFSPFTIGSSGPGNILPITLLSFTARATEAGLVDAVWTTASEINNDYFTLQRSRDVQHWEVVGTVQGAGNSNNILNYLYTDDAPYTGTSYYRIKQTDFDGTFTYSEVEVVRINSGNDGGFGLHSVFRTESAIDFVYTASAPYLTVEIYDISGRLVHGSIFENYEGQNRSTLNLNIARGVYVLRLSDGQREESRRFFY